MKKRHLFKLDLDVYSETLDNGLGIYVVPFPNVNNIYATFTTNFGSNKVEFIPINKNKMVKVPYGIAHFLEHKMFEQEDGSDPFNFYSSRGADANANTDNNKTTYLFSGTNFFKENLEYLLNYVQSPYFTDENVNKEKGIIEQEMRMYNDNPYSVMFEKMTANMYYKNPIRIPVIGTYDSIYSITKEDLYTCYNTFYHPSNMFLVITGNVNPNDVVDVVKKNQANKNFTHQSSIKRKEYNEPSKVKKDVDEIKMSVNIPKVGLGYKLNVGNIDVPYKKVLNYVSLLFDIKFDETSLINEQLKNDGIITDELYLNSVCVDNFINIFILGESKQPDVFLSRLKEVLKDTHVTDEDFNRKKKASIATLIGMSDNVYSINCNIVTNIMRYDSVITNDYDLIKELNIDEFNYVISNIDFTNTVEYTINPK